MANGRQDLRLALAWPTHVKTRRLAKRCGYVGAFNLIALWCYAGEHHPGGVLKGMAPDEIEECAGWTGTPGEFHKALVEVGWLDADGVTLHDWTEEQPWIASREQRIEEAKRLGKIGGEKSGVARRKSAARRQNEADPSRVARKTLQGGPGPTLEPPFLSSPSPTNPPDPEGGPSGGRRPEPEPGAGGYTLGPRALGRGFGITSDPGWRPRIWPYRDEVIAAYQDRGGLSTREAQAGMDLARKLDSWDIRPRAAVGDQA